MVASSQVPRGCGGGPALWGGGPGRARGWSVSSGANGAGAPSIGIGGGWRSMPGGPSGRTGRGGGRPRRCTGCQAQVSVSRPAASADCTAGQPGPGSSRSTKLSVAPSCSRSRRSPSRRPRSRPWFGCVATRRASMHSRSSSLSTSARSRLVQPSTSTTVSTTPTIRVARPNRRVRKAMVMRAGAECAALSWRSVGTEAVARAAHRFDGRVEGRRRVAADQRRQLGAQPLDADIDDIGAGVEVVAPDVFQDLAARADLARRAVLPRRRAWPCSRRRPGSGLRCGRPVHCVWSAKSPGSARPPRAGR